MVEKIKWKISAWVGAGKFKWSRNDTVDPDVEYHLVHEDEVMEKLAEKDKEIERLKRELHILLGMASDFKK